MRFDAVSQLRDGMLILPKITSRLQKGGCPNCGSMDIQDKTTKETGEEIPISSCHCGWWGARIEKTGGKHEKNRN